MGKPDQCRMDILRADVLRLNTEKERGPEPGPLLQATILFHLRGRLNMMINTGFYLIDLLLPSCFPGNFGDTSTPTSIQWSCIF